MSSKAIITQEFSLFCSRTKHLRKILRDTQRCFKDINNAGSLNGSQLLCVDFSQDEESELETITRRPPGIVVLGQNNQAKATIVNEILDKNILPVCDSAQEALEVAATPSGKSKMDCAWRTVRLRYGKRQRVSYCLANSFELLGEAEPMQKAWSTVPLETLQVCDKISVSDDMENDEPETRDDVSSENENETDPYDEEDRLSSPEGTGENDDDQNGDLQQDDRRESPPCTSPSSDPDNMRQDSDHRESPTNKYGKVRLRSKTNNNTCTCTAKSVKDINRSSLVIEVAINHRLLNDGAQIIVAQSAQGGDHSNMDTIVEMCTKDIVPVFIYAMMEDSFSDEEVLRLQELKKLQPGIAILFVCIPPQQTFSPLSTDVVSPMKKIRSTVEKQQTANQSILRNSMEIRKSLHEGSLDLEAGNNIHARRKVVSAAQSSLKLFQQLLELGYLNILPGVSPADSRQRPESDSDSADFYITESELIENFDSFGPSLLSFTHKVLQCQLVRIVTLLNIVHTRCLQMFIMSAFDMARDMMITPKRITFAKEKETELYNSLMDMALRKQDEIKKIIAETIGILKETLVEKAAAYDFIGISLTSSGEVTSSRDLKTCTSQIQDLVLGNLNSAVANKLLGSVDILKDSYTGVLTRCLESLEQSDTESKEITRTTLALREILTSAYQVEITIRGGASVVKVLLEKMKQLVHSMPWKPAPMIDSEWKRRVASDMLNSLSETRLAKSICSQIKERLKHSHETFSSALKQLEARHSGRLERTEAQRLRVRKDHAPKVARLALESTSFKDMVVYGMPKQANEIGRGQYGVVYACDAWSGYSPCAIKSVVPPDDKHWNDLAMEFFYTKNVPEHDRVVSLRGSVIDYTYGGGSPAVLLIMDRLQKDLYMAIRGGLDWPSRLRVAVDVVEGIRYLHSQGLVHRDIKLKNVLLDKHNRGKLTDLGFCKPEAMMSGSIVGTPIHMAPELFSGSYDNTVDVYAFGILFWYVCAGHVRLPYNFEQCTNKEMLWTSVRRGVRPEKLTQFEEPCWELMQACWHGEPNRRPLLGIVEPKLVAIFNRVRQHHHSSGTKQSKSKTSSKKIS